MRRSRKFALAAVLAVVASAMLGSTVVDAAKHHGHGHGRGGGAGGFPPSV
jgi:hypothetical protein